jgi:putative nucleotidyltransferase with HDIG domain
MGGSVETLGKTRQIPVEGLVVGLYVQALDRPWLETPFLFQGFPITAHSEIEELRRHCRYVYVDPERSEPAALAQASALAAAVRPAAALRTPPLPPAHLRERHDDVAGMFGEAPYPDGSRFRELLRAARDLRNRSRDHVEAVFRDIRLGDSVRTDGVRALVRDMVAAISANAGASLWLTSLKRRDEYTSIHCVNVCVLSLAFGRHLGLPRNELEVLGLGALLHDIGKMRTPDHILNKPGPLTAGELEVMRQHPEEGYRMMRDTGRIPDAALAIIRHHHERVSGEGYPSRMSGDSIPLNVMITALADVYDALTSDRVYRDALGADQALRIIYRTAEQDFGRELVEEFIRCLGIYPVGSVVELDSGAVGVVIASDRKARLRPVVALIRTPDGKAYDKRVIVNLAALAAQSEDRGWTVRRMLQDADYDFDVAQVVAAELSRR